MEKLPDAPMRPCGRAMGIWLLQIPRGSAAGSFIATISIRFFVMPSALAISGECASHLGVNCATQSLTGDAVCNDGWVSSVPYSETSECSATVSCLTSDEVAQLVQSAEQEYQPIIQNLENEEQQAVAEQQQTNQAQTESQAQQQSLLSQYHGVNSAMSQYWSDLAAKQQQAISSIEAQYQLSIANVQNELTQLEDKDRLQQCTPQQQTYLNYVSSTDTCIEQNGLNPSCLSQPLNASLSDCASGNVEQNGMCKSVASICGPNSYDYDPTTNNCICNAGYENSGLSCVPITPYQNPALGTYCQQTFGRGSTVQNGSCACAAGYEMNSGQTQCIAVPTTSITPPVLNNNNLPQENPAIEATSSTPQSFAINQNLTVGTSGSGVVSLQQFLEAKGFLALPSGTAVGYFGNLTKQAVIAFQKSVNLPATGYCGAMTRAAINNR